MRGPSRDLDSAVSQGKPSSQKDGLAKTPPFVLTF